MNAQHRVVIIGGGFAGICAARALKKSPVQITLVDRRNFHLFQPLLYQVASGGLSPANISAPLRVLLKHQKNTDVRLGDVVDIDPANRQLTLAHGDTIPYDSLILATGSVPHYFSHPEWEALAPPLKSISDAEEVRRRVLLAFESAETATDPETRKAWLTFIVAGGGTSGVEMAGALSELAFHTLRNDFRQFDPSSTRILVVEGGPRLVPSFPETLSKKAADALHRLGVEIKVGTYVTGISTDTVTLRHGDKSEKISARTVLWSAGVQASPLGRLVAPKNGAEIDKGGRLKVSPDLTLPGHPELIIAGDLAHFDHQNGKPLPGVAQVAIQQGTYAAKLITAHLENKSLPPFHYKDFGSLAVIGRNAAVADLGWLRVAGFPAWLLWSFVHLHSIVQFHNRALILIQWAWSYITRNQSALWIPETNPKSVLVPMEAKS